MPNWPQQRPRLGAAARRSRTKPPRSVSGRPRKMLSATLIDGTSDSSWWITATPSAAGFEREAGRTPGRRSRSCPAKSVWTPARILISVLLPAPFSPGQDVHLAAEDLEVDVLAAPSRGRSAS